MFKGKLILVLILSLISINSFAQISRGISGHSPGDVIALFKDEEIARWCDFDKQIVVTATNVLCIYKNK